VPPIKKVSLTEQVVEAIRQDIMTGRLRPGSLTSAQNLAETLGVSRSPVREALVRLAEIGMVRFEPNRGVRIIQPGRDELEEVFQLRLMLEPPAAYRAAQRADEALFRQLREELAGMQEASEAADPAGLTAFTDHDIRFHELVLIAAGNRRIVLLVRDLRTIIRTLSPSKLMPDNTDGVDLAQSRGLQEVIQEHISVLTALETRAPEAAAEAMYRHVEQTGQSLLSSLPEENSDQWTAGIVRWGLGR
jgi:DNA-binding GntR family transcriptional regulator